MKCSSLNLKRVSDCIKRKTVIRAPICLVNLKYIILGHLRYVNTLRSDRLVSNNKEFVLLMRDISLKVKNENVKFSNCDFCYNFSDYE